ncbi:metal-dependent hydrolase [Marinobacter persicus]|uniref:Inner membrane protein n=1 Tax=Marinobacter persicus TaxID=930118 RepID=A0A2S6G4S4_9GAMM|nr:metal-dependent hydrolase [Marinobacter persicus]PPK50707.1 inner membrane protein [Marinobacter persicus]PPK54105.1 inner membrane protein [Marinobacter persicus]PPK57292.1 inner membrane protein [Marinobacter persicus]
MDSVTQAALGATIAGTVAGKSLGRSALLIGGVLGTLPDLDVVIDYGSAVANFTQHRGFSHSLFLLAPLAILLAWAFWRWRPQVSLARWLTLTGLVLLTHPILDAFTTYGTQLFWPIGPPVAISSIFIIDPLYTLPLLLACIAFLIRPPAPRIMAVGLMLSTLYLGWTLVAQQWMTERVKPALAQAGLDSYQLLVQPMPFNTLLWRATAISDERRIEIVTGVFDGNQPLTLEHFPRNPGLRRQVASLPEVKRLEWFTRGFLDYQQSGDQVIATDIRLGVPGAHPFSFVVAANSAQGVTPLGSTRLPRPPLKADASNLLWNRITGEQPILCLATLSAPAPGEGC